MKLTRLLMPLAMAVHMYGEPKLVTLASDSPLVTFRVVFLTGAAADPQGKEGLASLTAAMLAKGGTRGLTYKQVLERLFPMAVEVNATVDKEMTAFFATTHRDNLESFYNLFRSMLLEPGWRQEDLNRLRDDAINELRVSIRGNNDEELGKEVLYNQIYAGHPYAHHNLGRVSSLRRITMDDVRNFYRQHYTQDNLILGLAGGFPRGFPQRVLKDLSKLPLRAQTTKLAIDQPKSAPGVRVTIVRKDTRGVAISLGFPIEVKRGHPDFPALLVGVAALGQHRTSGGRLYTRLREARGLNYGDYAYLEYFPRGMFRMEPEPNLARQSQIFQIWIRPVEPENAHFALRAALYELDKLVAHGLTQEEFERWRNFVRKNANLLMRTKSAELGYAIDSVFYGIPPYRDYLQSSLARLTLEQVNQAIRRHLKPQSLHIVMVAKDAERLRQHLASNRPSPVVYNSPKPAEILAEDKVIEKFLIPVGLKDIQVIASGAVFE